MDETGFLRFLKKIGRSERRRQGALESVKRFETYLSGLSKTLAGAEPVDLDGFAQTGQGLDALGISDYYEWTCGDHPVRWAAHARFAAHTFAGFKLEECMGTDPRHLGTLKAAGIHLARELLAAGPTPSGRAALAEATGVPVECILELVKLADLARAGGLKRIRGRLYYDGGFDTLDKLAAATAAEVRARLADYIDQTGFEGIPPTPKEADNAVHLARILERVVAY